MSKAIKFSWSTKQVDISNNRVKNIEEFIGSLDRLLNRINFSKNIITLSDAICLSNYILESK